MAVTTERMVAILEARLDKYEKGLARALGQTNQKFTAIERRGKQLESRLAAVAGNFGPAFARSLAFIGGARAFQSLLDGATRIDNALKVAGLSGAELDKVYGRLRDSAIRSAAPLETLVTLYGRAALVQKELGVSQEELLGFTDKVALALRVAGTDAQSASGALLQLSQALGAGTVRAEEFNSILEGALPIAQAAAAGISEAGGSVAKLRQLVVDGKVSSEAFFRGFEAGAVILEQKVAGATLTTEQGMTNLRTALVDAMREFSKGSLAAESLGDAFETMASRINAVDFEAFGKEVRELYGLLDQLRRALPAVQNSGARFGAATGLDRIGEWFTGGAAMRQIGPVTITSQTALQRRIDDAFGEAVETAGELTEDAIRRSAGQIVNETGKTDRLPSNKVNPVSLNDYKIDDEKDEDKTKRSAGRLANSFDGLNDAVQRYVNDVVKAESGGRANAKNPNSSATGLGQFIESTWLAMFRKEFPDRAANMSRETILALRTDAEVSRQLIEAYARENAAILRQAGVSVDQVALHLAHFLGPQGAVSVLKAAPGTPLSQLLSADAIAANRSILGGGRTAEDAIDYARGRVSAVQQEADIVGGPLTDAWDGLRETTDRTNDSLRETEAGYDALLSAAESTISTILSAFEDGKLDAQEILQIVMQLVQQLRAINQAGGLNLGGGGGLGGGLLGGILIPGFLAGGGPVRRNVRGRVRGPGGPTGDKIPTMLSNEEFVVRAAMAKKHGPLLEAINNDEVRRMAGGGAVGGGRYPAMGGGAGGGSVTIVQHLSFQGVTTTADVAKLAQHAADQSAKHMKSQVKQEFPGWQIELRRTGGLSR